jgi:hypothetical protein
MKVRLIKPGAQRANTNNEERPKEELQVLDTIRSWVQEFKSKKKSGVRPERLFLRRARKT